MLVVGEGEYKLIRLWGFLLMKCIYPDVEEQTNWSGYQERQVWGCLNLRIEKMFGVSVYGRQALCHFVVDSASIQLEKLVVLKWGN